MSVTRHERTPVRVGKGWKAYRRDAIRLRVPPFPYAAPLAFTAYRDAATGRWAKRPPEAPAGAPLRRATVPRPRPASDLRVTRRAIEWGDGSREVIGVSVRSASARVAHLRGEAPIATVRDYERELGLAMLAELNPAAAREEELALMHEGHRSAKGQRAALSRVRNAAARSEDLKRRGRAPAPPAPLQSASMSADLGELAGMLAQVAQEAQRGVVRVIRHEGQPPRLEVLLGGYVAYSYALD